MNRIEHNGKSYTDSDIVSAELFSELSPISETLGYGTFNAVVKSDTTAILFYEADSKLQYYYNDKLFATYYVRNIKRTGKFQYSIEAYDIVGVLSKQQHMGGIYTGESAREIINDICGNIDVVFDATVKDVKMYGWLPIASRRDNLRSVLFALGAVAQSTKNGALNIAGLSSRVVDELNNIGIGAQVEYPEPIGSISLTEHQFIKSSATELSMFYEGMTEENDVITFDEPVYDVIGEGIPIKSVHANYVIVGAGSGTISGKKYAHTKREVVRTVGSGSEEAIYDDATLVGLTNSAAVLDRLVNYYQQADVISGETRLRSQKPGDTVRVLHPYDLELVKAFVLDRQVTVSRKPKSYQRLLIGYNALNPAEGIYNHIDVISASGTFTVPEGVTRLRIVLIGGGTGGMSGAKGEDGEPGGIGGSNGDGGKGGVGGKAGTPGKTYQRTLNVTPGQTFVVNLGAAGYGGEYNPQGQGEGAIGGATFFGEYTSDSGSVIESGFYEEITGTVYAQYGTDGIAGGDGIEGGAGNETGPAANQTLVTYESQTWKSGATGALSYWLDGNTLKALAFGGGGGGAAVGQNGKDGQKGSVGKVMNGYDATGGNGGNGVPAIIEPKPAASYGSAGNGGHGGGGGGGGGGVREDFGVNWGGDGGIGGAGTSGGDGGQGVALVYYYLPTEDVPDVPPTGALRSADNYFLLDLSGAYLIAKEDE